jgi:tetratricopeptide (TPR) repeat protein
MCNDWESILEVCDRAESYVAEHPHYYQEGKVAAFYLKKMTAYLHLRDFKNGKLCVEKALKEFEDGQEIWFTILEYSLLLSLHTAHYLNALAILNLAVNHPKFKKLKVDQLDKWAVYHAYVDFFVESQEIQSNASSMSTKRLFKTGKLSSELIRFSKENRILDAHYMMAQLLFSLKRKNFSAASELVEKLVLFTTRQLKSDEYFRTIQFVRMIQQFEKANFKLQDLIKVEKYRQRLEDTPHVYRGRVSDLEIVPYEKLWKIVLEQA